MAENIILFSAIDRCSETPQLVLQYTIFSGSAKVSFSFTGNNVILAVTGCDQRRKGEPLIPTPSLGSGPLRIPIFLQLLAQLFNRKQNGLPCRRQ